VNPQARRYHERESDEQAAARRRTERNGVRQSDRESVTDADPHGLFFDPADDESFHYEHRDDIEHRHEVEHRDELHRRQPRSQPVSRVERRAAHSHRASRRRNRRVFLILSLLLVVVVVVATWLVVLPIYHYLRPSDYSGNGTGAVVVEVKANDGADAIGTTLHDKGVVASVRAFTDAAKSNPRSQNIQPGSYKLHSHMSAKNALTLLLDPSSRVNSDVVVTEGATTLDVVKRLTAAPCASTASRSAICGPGMDPTAVRKALDDVKGLGLPTDYTVAGKAPISVEGFLYPATYYFPSRTNATDAFGQMISKFTDEARSTNFTAQARTLHITPYQELIIASIAQSEAKYSADYAKVARVILNRIAAHKQLQIDATSAYAFKLKGLDPATGIYADAQGPYNTYKHTGLPPTPISNPGAAAMNGAAHPATGNWTYYVNADSQGHLFFTNSETAFARAVARCKQNNWGCG
jgi:UPF0755 protein